MVDVRLTRTQNISNIKSSRKEQESAWMPAFVCSFSNHGSSGSYSAIDGSTQDSPCNSLSVTGTEAYTDTPNRGTDHSNIENQLSAYSRLIRSATPEDTRDDLSSGKTALEHTCLMRYDRVGLGAIEALELVYHVCLQCGHLEEIDEATGGKQGELAFVRHVCPCRRFGRICHQAWGRQTTQRGGGSGGQLRLTVDIGIELVRL
jgi:hypothetical protein